MQATRVIVHINASMTGKKERMHDAVSGIKNNDLVGLKDNFFINYLFGFQFYALKTRFHFIVLK